MGCPEKIYEKMETGGNSSVPKMDSWSLTMTNLLWDDDFTHTACESFYIYYYVYIKYVFMFIDSFIYLV